MCDGARQMGVLMIHLSDSYMLASCHVVNNCMGIKQALGAVKAKNWQSIILGRGPRERTFAFLALHSVAVVFARRAETAQSSP